MGVSVKNNNNVADINSYVSMYDKLGQPSQIESAEMFEAGRPSNFYAH